MHRATAALIASLALLLGADTNAGAVAVPGEVAYALDGDIWVANADGSGARRLTTTRLESTPAWSPDGTKLAFASSRDDPTRRRGLFVMSGEGGDVRRLTDPIVSVFQHAPGWSPDGTQIAIVGIRAGSGNSDVLLVAADGSGARWLTNTQLQENAVQWSTTDRVLFGAFDGIYDVSSAGGPPRLLVPGGAAPALSPDRSRLAYVARRGASVALYVAGASGGNPRAFVPEREHAAGPLAWSTDGTKLAFTGKFSLCYSRYGEGFADHLWLLEPASGALRRLTGDPEDPHVPGLTAGFGDASWWPAGDRLFLQPSGGRVFTIDSSGRCGQPHAVFAQASGPVSWRPGARPTPAPLRCADLRVRAVPAKAQLAAGETLRLEVDVRNAGNVPATAVRLRLDPLTNARGVTASAVDRRCEGPVSVPFCELGTLEPGERVRATFTLAAGRSGVLLATAVATTTSPEALEPSVSAPSGATSYTCGVVGTWGNDVVRGTSRAESICTFTGADRVDGLGGNDRIESGNGDDTVTGGRGRDRISAAGGRDVIVVRDGERDVVSCGSERDTVVADRRDSIARDCERVLRR